MANIQYACRYCKNKVDTLSFSRADGVRACPDCETLLDSKGWSALEYKRLRAEGYDQTEAAAFAGWDLNE